MSSRPLLLVVAAGAAARGGAGRGRGSGPRAAPARRRSRGGRRSARRDRPRARRAPHGARGRRLRRPGDPAATAARRPLPRRQQHEDVRGHRALQLAGEGRLALEDTVERWLPGLVPGGGAITVRQLLNHTSGLPDYAPEDDDSFIRQVLADRHRKLDAAGAGRHRAGTPAAVRPRRGVGVLEHRLHPARADRRGGERAPAGDRAPGADLRAAAPARHDLRHRLADRGAPRPRLLALRRAPQVRHHRGRPVVGGRRGRDRVDRRATSRASTARFSAGACCAATCSPRCARRCPSAARGTASG